MYFGICETAYVRFAANQTNQFLETRHFTRHSFRLKDPVRLFRNIVTKAYKAFVFISECTDDYPCQGLGEHAHFRNFGMAFLTLFRVATGDNWNGIMKVGLLFYFCNVHAQYIIFKYIYILYLYIYCFARKVSNKIFQLE